MAWTNVNITVNGETFLGHRRDLDFAVRYESGLKVGDTFTVEGVTYTALSVDDEANRNEILNIKATEVKNDKPKARRNEPRNRADSVPSEDNDGHDYADGDSDREGIA